MGQADRDPRRRHHRRCRSRCSADSCTLGPRARRHQLPDDGHVSGLHARVALRDGRVFLVDLGSTNGTFPQGQRERSLGHEAFVLLGRQLFRLNLAV